MKHEMQTLAIEVTRFEPGDPAENPWVEGAPRMEEIAVVPYDPVWSQIYERVRNEIEGVLGSRVVAVEHIGSTAVPGLSAKPVIDIDLIISDPDQEEDYLPQLTELGFVLTIRERSWYRHRMLRRSSPRVNLHVFPPDSPEHIRHKLFRDWLRTNQTARAQYAAVKKQASKGMDTVAGYNERKHAVVHEIYHQIFMHYGLAAQPDQM